MSQPSYRLWVRGRDRASAVEVDYTRDLVSVEIIERFNDTGTYILDLVPGAPAAEAMAPGCGLVVQRDNQPWFSGPWESSERVIGVAAESVAFTGIDDTGQLADRLIRPDNVALDAGGRWIYDGNGQVDTIAETMMHEFVSYQAGPTARADLAIPGLTMGTDSGRGAVISKIARLDNLMDVLRDIALRGGGLGFRVVQVGSALQFQTYMPGDKTSLIVFSRENGNLRSATVVQQAPTANGIIVGGNGALHDRQFAESIDTSSAGEWLRVIDLFSDQRQEELSVLSEAVIEEMEKGAGGFDVRLTLSDTDTLRYGRDYGLGDRVTVLAGQLEISGLISEVKTSISADGVIVTPTVTTTSVASRTRRSGGTARHLRQLQTSAEGFTRGMVLAWARAVADIPAGWQFCDGSNGTPNMRDRFIIGAGTTYTLLATGGAATINLQHGHEMPHTHEVVVDHPSFTISTANSTDINNDMAAGANARSATNHEHDVVIDIPSLTTTSGGVSTPNTGNALSTAQSILPPYLALNWIIRL